MLAVLLLLPLLLLIVTMLLLVMVTTTTSTTTAAATTAAATTTNHAGNIVSIFWWTPVATALGPAGTTGDASEVPPKASAGAKFAAEFAAVVRKTLGDDSSRGGRGAGKDRGMGPVLAPCLRPKENCRFAPIFLGIGFATSI